MINKNLITWQIVKPLLPSSVGLSVAVLYREVYAIFTTRHCNKSIDIYGKSEGLPVSYTVLVFADTHLSSFYPNELLFEPALRHARYYFKPNSQLLLGDAMNNAGGQSGGPFHNISNAMFRVFSKRLKHVLSCKPTVHSAECIVLPGNHDLMREATSRWHESGYFEGNQPFCLGPIPTYFFNTQSPILPSETNVLLSVAHIPYSFRNYFIDGLTSHVKAAVHIGAHVHASVVSSNKIVLSTVDPILAKLQEMQDGCGGLPECRMGPSFGVIQVHQATESHIPLLQNFSHNCSGSDNIGALTYIECPMGYDFILGFLQIAVIGAIWAFHIKSFLLNIFFTSVCILMLGFFTFFPLDSWNEFFIN